ILRRPLRRIPILEPIHTTPFLKPNVPRERKSHPADTLRLRIVIIPYQHTVVGMKPLPRRNTRRIGTVIIIGQYPEAARRVIGNVGTKTRHRVELTIALPSIDDPGLDLKMLGRKDLYTHPIEEPGSIVGSIGSLVFPVLYLEIRIKTDIGKEKTS